MKDLNAKVNTYPINETMKDLNTENQDLTYNDNENQCLTHY